MSSIPKQQYLEIQESEKQDQTVNGQEKRGLARRKTASPERSKVDQLKGSTTPVKAMDSLSVFPVEPCIANNKSSTLLLLKETLSFFTPQKHS